METAGMQNNIEATVLRMVALRADAVRALARHLGMDDPTGGEDDRLAEIKGRAVAPDACGPEIPMAPARGRMVEVRPVMMQMTDAGWQPQHGGYRGRNAARASDVFDEMGLQARRAGGAAPFTARQIAAGRAYAALVERHASVGIKGRSIETAGGSGTPGSGGIMDLIIDEGRAIASMQAAIGDGWALAVHRQGRRRRVPLTVRELVDRVCLRGETLSGVLEACGWSVYGETVTWAREALAGALDRMAGWHEGG